MEHCGSSERMVTSHPRAQAARGTMAFCTVRFSAAVTVQARCCSTISSTRRTPPTETERGSRGRLNSGFQVAGSPRQSGTGRHRGAEGAGGGIEEGQDPGGSSSSGGSNCHEREVSRTRQEAVGSRRHRISSGSEEEIAMRARDCRGRSRFGQDAGGTFCVRRGTEDRSAAVAG